VPLHKIAQPGDPGTDDVCATAVSDQRVAKYRLLARTSLAQEIYRRVQDEMMLDGSSRQNLATLSTTWAEPEAHRLIDESFDENMIDKDDYPQMVEIENRRVHMIFRLGGLCACAADELRLGNEIGGGSDHGCRNSARWHGTPAILINPTKPSFYLRCVPIRADPGQSTRMTPGLESGVAVPARPAIRQMY
jgi:hypothetical protein